MPAEAAVPARTANGIGPWRIAWAGLGAGLALLVAGYFATLAGMATVWGASGTYHHGFLVLPTFAYVLWQWRPRIERHMPQGSVVGVGLAALCGLLWLAADLVAAAEGQHIAVVAGIGALFLAVLGWPAFRAALPVLLLLIYWVPTGGQLLPALKSTAAWFGVAGAKLAGLAATRDGLYRFTVAGQGYQIIDDCAALAELFAATFVALTLGLLLFRRPGKILAFAGLAAGVAVLVNGLRIIAIVLYNHVQGEIMPMSAHLTVGWVAIAVAIFGLVIAAHRFREDTDHAQLTAANARDGKARPWRAGALGLLAALLMIAVPSFWPAAVPVGHRTPLRQALPTELGAWRLSDRPGDWRPTAAHADKILHGVYSNGDRQVTVSVALAHSPRTEISGASLDIVPAGPWRIAEDRPDRLCRENACWPVRTITLEHGNEARIRHATVLMLANGRPVASPTRLRLRRAWGVLSGQPVEAAAIVMGVEAHDPLPAEAAGPFFALLVDALHLGG